MGDQSHPKPTEVSSAQKVSPSPVVDTSAQGLVFKDICVDVATKRILWSVSGHARPGAVLAILGPSGSGKTTLLNTLAGQVKKSSGLMITQWTKAHQEEQKEDQLCTPGWRIFP